MRKDVWRAHLRLHDPSTKSSYGTSNNGSAADVSSGSSLEQTESPKEAVGRASAIISELLPPEDAYSTFQLGQAQHPFHHFADATAGYTANTTANGHSIPQASGMQTSPFGELNLLNPAAWPLGPLDMSCPEDTPDWLDILLNSYPPIEPVSRRVLPS